MNERNCLSCLSRMALGAVFMGFSLLGCGGGFASGDGEDKVVGGVLFGDTSSIPAFNPNITIHSFRAAGLNRFNIPITIDSVEGERQVRVRITTLSDLVPAHTELLAGKLPLPLDTAVAFSLDPGFYGLEVMVSDFFGGQVRNGMQLLGWGKDPKPEAIHPLILTAQKQAGYWQLFMRSWDNSTQLQLTFDPTDKEWAALSPKKDLIVIESDAADSLFLQAIAFSDQSFRTFARMASAPVSTLRFFGQEGEVGYPEGDFLKLAAIGTSAVRKIPAGGISKAISLGSDLPPFYLTLDSLDTDAWKLGLSRAGEASPEWMDTLASEKRPLAKMAAGGARIIVAESGKDSGWVKTYDPASGNWTIWDSQPAANPIQDIWLLEGGDVVYAFTGPQTRLLRWLKAPRPAKPTNPDYKVPADMRILNAI